MIATCPFAGYGSAARPPATIELQYVPGLYPASLSEPPRFAAAFASLSTRLPISLVFPACQTNSTRMPAFARAFSKSSQRSLLRIGCPSRLRHPLLFQNEAMPTNSVTYVASETTSTHVTPSQGAFRRTHF